MGTDLNRRWDNPLPWGQPTIYAVRKFVFNIDKDKVRAIGAGLVLYMHIYPHMHIIMYMYIVHQIVYICFRVSAVSFAACVVLPCRIHATSGLLVVSSFFSH